MTNLTEAMENGWAEGLMKFVERVPKPEGWQSAVNPQRLLEFISLARPLLHAAPTAVERQSKGAAPDTGRLASALEALSPALMVARGAAGFANPWTLAGLGRFEVRNAAVLAALWSPSVAGYTAVRFLDAFLRRLPPDLGLPTQAELSKPYVVRTEHCAAGTATERVDITIEGEAFVLGVEVKIDAGEGPDQLGRYVATIAKWGRARSRRPSVVLLASFAPSRGDVFGATWADVVAAARSIMPRRRRDYRYTHHLIDSFALHAARFRKERS